MRHMISISRQSFLSPPQHPPPLVHLLSLGERSISWWLNVACMCWVSVFSLFSLFRTHNHREAERNTQRKRDQIHSMSMRRNYCWKIKQSSPVSSSILLVFSMWFPAWNSLLLSSFLSLFFGLSFFLSLRRLISNSLKVTATLVIKAVYVKPEVASWFSWDPSATRAWADYHCYHCHRI